MRAKPLPLPCPVRRHTHGARAYTVVEVLLSLTVLAIGASAVMSMQKATLQGNLDARKTDMANSIARMWVERVRKDAMQWTQASAPPSNAKLLGYVDTGWVRPDAYAGNTPPVSPGFDILGRDISTAGLTPSAGVAPPVFCVNIQETSVYKDSNFNNLIRLDVRVLWVRGITGGATNPCDSTVATSALPSPQLYQSVYLTTAIRPNALP
jgi:type II secretory pathway pseudopilin PulG